MISLAMCRVGLHKSQDTLHCNPRTRQESLDLFAFEQLNLVEVRVPFLLRCSRKQRPGTEANQPSTERPREPVHRRQDEVGFDREGVRRCLNEVVPGNPTDLAAELRSLVPRHVLKDRVAYENVEVMIRERDCVPVVELNSQVGKATGKASRLSVVLDVEKRQIGGDEILWHVLPEVARSAEVADS